MLTKLIQKHALLLGILIIAFALRAIGLGYGLPHEFIGDEFIQVAIALTMLNEHALTPNFPDIFYHQPLSAYISTFGIGGYLAWQLLVGGFESINVLRDFYVIHANELLIIPRFISALLGTLALIFIYLAGRDLFSKKVGLIATWFGATELLLVYINHSGRVWGYMIFFIAFALWASTKLLKTDTTKNYTRSVIATLLAAANLLPGIFTFIPSLVARFRWKNKKIWYASLGIVAGLIIIIAINPRGLGALLFRFQSLSGSGLVEAVAGRAVEYEVQPTPIQNRIFDTFITLINFAPLYMLLAIIGGVLLYKKEKKAFIFLISFPIAYYLFIGPFFGFGWVARTLVPLMLYGIIFAAYAAETMMRKYNLKTTAAVAAVMLFSTPSLISSILLDVKLVKDDTREQAINWIYENLPEHTKILYYSETPESLNQDKSVLEVIAVVAPGTLSKKQKMLLTMNEDVLPKPNFFIWDIRKIPKQDLPENFFKENEFQYYIRILWDTEDRGKFDEIIENQFSKKKLIKSFSPFKEGGVDEKNFGNVHNMIYPWRALLNAEQFGPIVEIYEITF
ncbi:MAG: hypothetical protein COU08_02415 [Candidatus Harrisonbacteria bacterium CG10_big_fil_rev_8_21_14_0_10_42_17]|uniref:Uncharacterized protein n=1 Tax=Candidatus Harrisonbacteria bacterium CG10_big_fil_rev_8_21_14_0_10_42_17 TaxID=1974584 RepID=A0A2M6WI66_9BACT|nr:MAG: hypothetical protein COU08_02415 [Candidatus Harrisonbacteria bacterium CG10_big_fil_rev_8_21_14_0_10_42_17]